MGFMGFKQAAAIGANVRKGEKATRIVFFNRLVDEATEKTIPYSRLFNVFNVAQLDNLPPEMNTEPLPIPEGERLNSFNSLLTASRIPHRLGGSKPCYYPKLDLIEMPNFDTFITGHNQETDFVSTFGHEIIHATNHPTRLDRKFEGEDKYGWEELVAELGSAFVCSHLGYSYNDAQSPAYLAGWLKVIKKDAKALFQIASQASKAADWFLEQGHAVTVETPDCEKAPRQDSSQEAA
jgi:antirestriction protein ArdC